jgi:uroporphyrinogen-III synthase
MNRALVVLRPLRGATRTAAAIRERGLTAIEVPLFGIEPIAWTPPPAADFDALALTSANAVACAGPALAAYRHLPVYAVGEATAQAAREAGFAVRHSGGEDGTALARAASEDGVGRLLHLCGREHRPLDRSGLMVTACPVYAAEAVAELPPAAEDALRSGAIALLHSPRAAALLARLVDVRAIARSKVAIAAISTATAAAAGDGWGAIAVADRPNDDALLAAALAMCDHPGCRGASHGEL